MPLDKIHDALITLADTVQCCIARGDDVGALVAARYIVSTLSDITGESNNGKGNHSAESEARTTFSGRKDAARGVR
jgi:hypothetical protein